MGFFVWFENSKCTEKPGAAGASERTSASGLRNRGGDSDMSDEGKEATYNTRF
jgi:hypothetical protein